MTKNWSCVALRLGAVRCGTGHCVTFLWKSHLNGQIANSHKLKIQDGGGRNLEFRITVNNSKLDTDIWTKLYGKMTTAMWR